LDLPLRVAVLPDRDFDLDRAEAELFFDLDFGAPLAGSIVATERVRTITREVERALSRASDANVI
jgi:hypothetical protein